MSALGHQLAGSVIEQMCNEDTKCNDSNSTALCPAEWPLSVVKNVTPHALYKSYETVLRPTFTSQWKLEDVS